MTFNFSITVRLVVEIYLFVQCNLISLTFQERFLSNCRLAKNEASKIVTLVWTLFRFSTSKVICWDRKVWKWLLDCTISGTKNFDLLRSILHCISSTKWPMNWVCVNISFNNILDPPIITAKIRIPTLLMHQNRLQYHQQKNLCRHLERKRDCCLLISWHGKWKTKDGEWSIIKIIRKLLKSWVQ
jgi:hypothetical protein